MTEDLFELDCLTQRIESLENRLSALENLSQVPPMRSTCNYPSAEFNDFWQAYPRKKDCKKAWAAWQKCRNRPAIEEILDAIKDQRKSDQWQKGIIPLPTTWINGERWDDET